MRRIGFAMGVCGLLVATAVAAQNNRQEILGPGLYIYQTRITEASCDDARLMGRVDSFVAAINGIPRSRTMEMMLVNSEYWKEWGITVRPNGTIVGRAQVRGRSASFEVRRNGSRFTGTGHREYRSDGSQCRIEFDALLRRIDVQSR